MNEKPQDDRVELRQWEAEEAERTKTLTCSICFQPIPNDRGWTQGNNAEPVNDGRCCNHCNNSVVIPARLNQATRRMQPK